jgi:hypothetical protein
LWTASEDDFDTEETEKSSFNILWW